MKISKKTKLIIAFCSIITIIGISFIYFSPSNHVVYGQCVSDGSGCSLNSDCCTSNCIMGTCGSCGSFVCDDYDLDNDGSVDGDDLDICGDSIQLNPDVDDPCGDIFDLTCVGQSYGKICNEDLEGCTIELCNSYGFTPDYVQCGSSCGVDTLGTINDVCPAPGDACYCCGEPQCDSVNCTLREVRVNGQLCSAGPPLELSPGDDFLLTYQFRGTEGIGAGAAPYEIRSGYRDGAPIWCDYDDNFTGCMWHSEIRQMTCPVTPGLYNFEIICYGSSVEDEGERADSCGYSYQDDNGICQIQCGQVLSIGHIRVGWSADPNGYLKLNIIDPSDSDGDDPVRIALPGSVIGAADLVDTTDANASPVRIQTQYGIKSWRILE